MSAFWTPYIEEELKNAARYRWLVRALFQRDPAITVGEASIVMRVYGCCPSLEDVDAAIDIEMAKESK